MSRIWVVATDGTAGGAGTRSDPRTFESLIAADSPVAAGDTILMRAGTYSPLTAGETRLTYLDGRAGQAGKGCYTLKINGSSEAQITIRNWAGEAVRINGGLHATTGQASYITIRGIEIAPTPTTRSFANENAVDYPAIYITAPGIKVYNCYLHDLQTIYPMGAVGFEMDGCIVGWNGFYSSDLAYNRGYNLYAHNHPGGVVNIKNNVFLYSFNSTYQNQGYNLHFFGTTANVRDYEVLYNIIVYGRLRLGNATLVNSGNKINHNYFTGARAGIAAITGVTNANASDIEILYNTLWDSIGNYLLDVRGFKTLDVEHNLAINSSSGSGEMGIYYPNNSPVSVAWDNQAYWGTNGSSSFFYNGTLYNFANWKTASGVDALSTITDGKPTSNTVELIPAANGKRGFVVAMNYLAAASVTVDLTPLGLEDGARCRYSNCLNMSEYVDFTFYRGSPTLTISMQAADWSMRTPTGYDSPVSWPAEPFPSYGVWLVEEVSRGMNIEEAVYDFLVNDAEVYALVEARLYPMTIPQEIERPAAAYQVLSHDEIMDHDGESKLRRARVQFTVQADSFEGAKEAAREIAVTLRGYKGLMGGASGVTVESCEILNEFDGWGSVGGVHTTRVDVGIMYRA